MATEGKWRVCPYLVIEKPLRKEVEFINSFTGFPQQQLSIYMPDLKVSKQKIKNYFKRKKAFLGSFLYNTHESKNAFEYLSGRWRITRNF